MKNGSKKGLSQDGKKKRKNIQLGFMTKRFPAMRPSSSVLAKEQILELRERGNWFSVDYLKLINLIPPFRQG